MGLSILPLTFDGDVSDFQGIGFAKFSLDIAQNTQVCILVAFDANDDGILQLRTHFGFFRCYKVDNIARCSQAVVEL